MEGEFDRELEGFGFEDFKGDETFEEQLNFVWPYYKVILVGTGQDTAQAAVVCLQNKGRFFPGNF